MLFLANIENLEILKCYIFSKRTLIISITCSNSKNEDAKIFNIIYKKSNETSKILRLIKMIKIIIKTWLKKKSQEFRLKNADETIKVFLEEIE